ncbi:F0F1 ATP synthase subunit epsilon [Actibacterium sp. MT2.3-13A]|uniref:F0F1 ATP synthase subunit epsilon n=1 Tax=Actibacterium sp. MT2.3-13A TaxID=2828332 RepID=UPI001BA99CF2|nr:F0F1 ATP synthase subunit epsilon [Actibacterium sp. MT2.3-13A]
MRLRITTPVAVVAEEDGILYLRAEDSTGAFGILPGHADFVTALATSVVTWRDAGAREHFVVVEGGVLMVRDGGNVEIATRNAVREQELGQLGRKVLEEVRLSRETEEAQRTTVHRLHLATMRQIQKVLDVSRKTGWPGAAEPGGEGGEGGAP